MAAYRSSFLIITTIAILASLLYWPFLHSGLIFDDQGLFLTGVIYDYAQIPFDFRPRTFPYFTLGFVSVLNSALEANRIVSLVLHILCAWGLYFLLKTLLIQTLDISGKNEVKETSRQATILAFLGAAWFSIHPIAVYGAGYLAQRTILFATLFSILSLWFYRRAFAKKRNVDMLTAALFYALALYSKEHAIMLPLAAVTLTAIYDGSLRSNFKRIALYLALCFPVAVSVFWASKHIVASSYEPEVGAMLLLLRDISIIAEPWGKWVVSIILQTGFFFDYMAFWIVPDVSLLSADMRFDFVRIWFSWWIFPKAFLFFLTAALAIYFLRKKGLIALFCCGFLYCWFLFLTELAAVRFQEPFVLYRSYLWAPGYVMMIVAVCARVPHRWLMIATIPVFAFFLLLARERLTSLATEASVWKDAASKLALPSLIGSDRIFYNRGRAYLQEKKYAEAIADFSLTIEHNPKVSQAYYNRALAYFSLEKFPEALSDLKTASVLNNKNSSILNTQGLVLERLGCSVAAMHSYSASMELGDQFAKIRLQELVRLNTVSKNKNHRLDGAECPG
ncbi:hypothetical protein [Herminiimonas aquatilis]|uniref:Tetratricopeptide repeat protein n=1 Tax=Herminiimonas aquatilis TaxID=345342 RepID=A0ABW2J7H3_9BURK